MTCVPPHPPLSYVIVCTSDYRSLRKKSQAQREYVTSLSLLPSKWEVVHLPSSTWVLLNDLLIIRSSLFCMDSNCMSQDHPNIVASYLPFSSQSPFMTSSIPLLSPSPNLPSSQPVPTSRSPISSKLIYS